MKSTKRPSAKTLARKSKEGAMIAWAKQQQAQFKADLREMFARERRAPGDPGGTGIKTKRWLLEAPGLENKPRLSDLLLGDAEKKADDLLVRLRRSREQEMARSRAKAKAEAVRREEMREFEKRKSGVSQAAKRYIDERGMVKGKLGTPVWENTYIPPSVQEKVAQAVRTGSPVPTDPQPVSADYAGGGWYRHRTTNQVVWMRGLRDQAGLDRLGIPGNYLGNSATIGNGEYETFYLPDGKSFRRQVETLKPENYTALKKWEDKAKKGGLENIIYSITYDFINQPYICLRAFAKMPDKSIAGRGLNPQEKFNDGLMGFVTIFTSILPLKFSIPKGVSPETSFRQYAKMTKGSYTGVTSEKRFKAMWNDLRRDKFFLEANSGKDFDNMNKAIQRINNLKEKLDDPNS